MKKPFKDMKKIQLSIIKMNRKLDNYVTLTKTHVNLKGIVDSFWEQKFGLIKWVDKG